MKPILFNKEMVIAILEGRKTATRRVIKLPEKTSGKPLGVSGDIDNPLGFMYPCGIKRPPYKVNDVLYVRETFGEWTGGYVYRAWIEPFPQAGAMGVTWKPSIHMPKEAARIFLKVTDVRVERLQDINFDGFLSEGVTVRPEAFNDPDNAYLQAEEVFIRIWDSTIKKDQFDHYSWSANPYVWVIEFERCEKPDNE